MEKNLHEGHRKRVKNRFLNEGLDGFEDHQVLEMLLFYSIPYKDTNEIAHNLLIKYGSLSGVFEADPKDLSTTIGVGENSAVLLSLIPSLARRYLKNKLDEKPQLTNTEIAANYIKNYFIGRTNEAFYCICLDSQLKVVFPALVSEGTVKEAAVFPRQVVETVIRHNASSVILSHNHPGGIIKPSEDDVFLTQRLVNILEPLSVKVRDHIIFCGEEYYSFSRNGIMPVSEV